MRGTAGARDYRKQTAAGGLRRIFQSDVRRAMRRHNTNFMWYLKFFHNLGRCRHVLPVALAAHDHADNRLLAIRHGPLRSFPARGEVCRLIRACAHVKRSGRSASDNSAQCIRDGDADSR